MCWTWKLANADMLNMTWIRAIVGLLNMKMCFCRYVKHGLKTCTCKYVKHDLKMCKCRYLKHAIERAKALELLGNVWKQVTLDMPSLSATWHFSNNSFLSVVSVAGKQVNNVSVASLGPKSIDTWAHCSLCNGWLADSGFGSLWLNHYITIVTAT